MFTHFQGQILPILLLQNWVFARTVFQKEKIRVWFSIATTNKDLLTLRNQSSCDTNEGEGGSAKIKHTNFAWSASAKQWEPKNKGIFLIISHKSQEEPNFRNNLCHVDKGTSPEAPGHLVLLKWYQALDCNSVTAQIPCPKGWGQLPHLSTECSLPSPKHPKNLKIISHSMSTSWRGMW